MPRVKLKILYVTEYSKIGGGEKNLYYLMKEVSKTHSVTLWCPPGDFADLVRTNSQVLVREFDWLNRKRWLFSFPLYKDLKKASALSEGFDIIHTYSINTLPLFKHFSHKVVHTIHGFWEKPYGKRGQRMNKLLRLALPVSKDVLNNCSLDESKLCLVPLGVELGKFTEDSRKEEISTKSEGIPLALCLARFQKIKGQDLLLNAFNESNQNYRLSFVGGVNSSNKEDQNFYNMCLKMSSSRNLEFHGFVQEPTKFLKSCDFVIIPSRYESFGVVAVESLACGKPVVAPRVGGLVDIVDESVGEVFDVGSVESLKQAIEAMCKRFKDFDSGVLRERSLKYDVKKQAIKLIKIYKEVSSESSAHL